MISRKDALRLIEGSAKERHGLLVGHIMAVLSGSLGGDRSLWERVGILHDLDYDDTLDDGPKHGVAAAEALKGKLPDEALYAIMSHDDRAGVQPFSKLDHSLIFADSLAVVAEEGGLRRPVTEDAFGEALRRVSEAKPWIRDIVEGFPYGAQVNVVAILNIVAE